MLHSLMAVKTVFVTVNILFEDKVTVFGLNYKDATNLHVLCSIETLILFPATV